MNKLLPCPFCGGEAHFERVGTNKVSCIVACEDCGASLETGETWDSGANWNTRAQLDEAVRVIDELVALKHIKDTQGKTAEYLRRQPIAWKEAQAFIKGVRGCT